MSGILALDLATRLGWAHATDEALAGWPAFGVLGARAGPHDGVTFGGHLIAPRGTQLGPLLSKFETWLGDKLGEVEPGLVVFEKPWFGVRSHQRTVTVLMGLTASAEVACDRAGIECRAANVASVRKHFMGKAKGKRPDLKAVCVWVCKQRGWQVGDDDDAADALAILDYSAHCTRRSRAAA